MDSGAAVLVMSSEFTRKQEFKLKKIKRSIYVRNMNSTLNKEGPIENTMEVNIYYQGHSDEVSREVWKIVETKVGEVRVAETERRRGKRGSRKEARRKGKEKGEKTEETKEGENDRCEEDSRRI